MAQWNRGPDDPIPRSVILPPAPAFRTALAPLLLPRGSTVPDRYWGHWNLRDGTAQEPGPPPVVRQALQSLRQRSDMVRRITLDREGSFEQRNALLSCPGLAELVGRPAPRPPQLDVGLQLNGAHQLAEAAGEAVEEPNGHGHSREEDGEEYEDFDTDGRGNAFPSGSDLPGHPPENVDPQDSA